MSARTRASAVKPANAMQMWSSMLTIFFTIRASWSWAALFFSMPSTTTSCGAAQRDPTRVNTLIPRQSAWVRGGLQ